MPALWACDRIQAKGVIMSNFVVFDKMQAQVLKWLKRGAAKDNDRPIMQCLHVEDDWIVSADGFHLFVTKAGQMFKQHDLPPGDYEIDLISSASRAAGVVVDVNGLRDTYNTGPEYPKWRSIVPSEEVKSWAVVNPQLLIEILQGMKGLVKIGLNGKDQMVEIMGKLSDEETDVYAVLMPIHTNNDEFNRPDFSEKVPETSEQPVAMAEAKLSAEGVA
jgi:hypothetical protein